MSVVTVIYNPASGGSIDPDDLRAAVDASANGHRITWSPTTADDTGAGQALDAVSRHSDTVVACGGDGTVRAVLESLAGSGVPLGVVPLGTGNLLATNLGIDAGLESIPRALSGEVTSIDVGVVNGERFAVMAGVGFDAMMIRDASSQVKRRFGSLAYVVSGARNVPAKVVSGSIVIDGAPVWSGRTAMVLVGNCGAVTGGLPVFPDASPHDGLLDVAVLTAERATDWFRVLWRLVRRLPQPDHLVRRFVGREIDVRLDRAMPYEMDGEDREATNRLEFRVEPGALEVRC